MRLKQWAARLSLSVLAGSAGVLFVAAAPARADVKLPAVLSDHMVLQQGMPVPVWGTADAGEEVTVSFGEQKQAAKAGADGKWSVKLTALTASDKPADLTVQGKNKVTLGDVLVGEVWVCSGQSNMEFGIGGTKNSKEEIANANFPNIRLFTVPKAIKEEPQSDTSATWAACSPQTVGGFTAVGYFFGRELHQNLKVPVGLIHSSWGGTVAEAWATHEVLAADPEFAQILDRGKVDPEQYKKQVEAWEKAAAQARNEGKKVPNKPNDAGHNPNRASVLYNGMIAPIVPFACKGAIWYQGESNAGRADQYRKLLPAMIKSWRDVWGEPNMDFLIVSLANFQDPPKEPGESDWAELRKAQWLTAEQPHNGQALAIDLADPENPKRHPPQEQAGRRPPPGPGRPGQDVRQERRRLLRPRVRLDEGRGEQGPAEVQFRGGVGGQGEPRR